MTRFALLFSLLLPLSALAQLQVFQFDGTTDTPLTDGALVNVCTAAPGDTVKARFHVRNTGQGPATFETLALAGQGFTILSAPSLPTSSPPTSDWHRRPSLMLLSARLLSVPSALFWT